jgi:hypothetical protein
MPSAGPTSSARSASPWMRCCATRRRRPERPRAGASRASIPRCGCARWSQPRRLTGGAATSVDWEACAGFRRPVGCCC